MHVFDNSANILINQFSNAEFESDVYVDSIDYDLSTISVELSSYIPNVNTTNITDINSYFRKNIIKVSQDNPFKYAVSVGVAGDISPGKIAGTLEFYLKVNPKNGTDAPVVSNTIYLKVNEIDSIPDSDYNIIATDDTDTAYKIVGFTPSG
jgi:hypothetical protein